MEINQLFILLYENNHEKFIRYYKKYETEINENVSLQNPLKILINELEIDSENKIVKKSTKEWVDTLHVGHYGNILKLQDEELERITVCFIKLYRDSDLDLCKQNAKKFPNNAFCQEMLNEIEEEVQQKGRIVKLFHAQNSNKNLKTSNSKIGIKEKYRESILKTLRYLRPSTYKPVTISQLYDCMSSESHDFEDKQMYYDCLRELRDEEIINFKDTANGCPVYFTR